MAIAITSYDVGIVGGTKSIELTLDADSGYTIGSVTRSVTIQDNDLPTVSVYPVSPVGTRADGPSPQFTVTRTGETGSALTVYYESGTTGGATLDEGASVANVTILAGQTSATFSVTPGSDSDPYNPVYAGAYLQPDSSSHYTVAPVCSWAVDTLAGEYSVPLVGAEPIDIRLSKMSLTSDHFTLLLNRSPGYSLVVPFVLEGTAQQGTDFQAISGVTLVSSSSGHYTYSGSVTFGPNDTEADINIVPLADGRGGGDKVLSLVLPSDSSSSSAGGARGTGPVLTR